MSVDKFKFVSPGIFIDEVDESGIPSLPERMGPLVIGRFQRGPGLRPVKVDSYKEFVQTFGDPAPGNASSDIWRTGEMTAPTYAAYAVKAWLRNNAPCTVYRVLGNQASNADSTAAAQAGWTTTNTFSDSAVLDVSDMGGAYGLFVFPSASAHLGVTGTLAAVWYVNDGAMVLTGTGRGEVGTGERQGAGIMIKSESGISFTAKILQDGGSESDVKDSATFNFNRDSDLFIRKVFNTDPSKVNSTITPSGQLKNYWLGETFESNLVNGENSKLRVTGTLVQDTDNFYGVVLAMRGSELTSWAAHQSEARAAQTGWFISQDTRGSAYTNFHPVTHTEELFKFHALDSGDQANRDYKVSIANIKVPTDNYNKFGTFSVLVRKASDTDNTPAVLEQYSGCNLDPTSPDYIGRKIGDRYYTYDETNRRVVEHGDNENRSKILRVEMSDYVRDGGAPGKSPFGVYGPARVKTHQLTNATTSQTILVMGSGSASPALPADSLLLSGDFNPHSGSMVHTGVKVKADGTSNGMIPFTGSIVMPSSRLRVSSSEGALVQASKAYFGYQSNVKGTRRFDQTHLDVLRAQPKTLDPTGAPSSLREYSWVFTLDDVQESAQDSNHAVWVSGSRASQLSFTAKSGSGDSNGVPLVLSKGFDQFTSPMFGGSDGFDVTWQDPLANVRMTGSPTEKNNTTFYSLKKAIDITSDTDFLEFDLATMPGITNTSLTTQLVNSCEERADALAVVDLPNGYKPPHERKTTETSTDALGSVTETVNSFKDMNLNSSYGCAFYPWVRVRDNNTNALIYVPPSVVALGTFSSSQRKSAVWFAPAGFTRGGLSEGSAGLPVVGVRSRLTSAERDKLYDANINPIASFPAEGIVIFGQKTMQVTRSALDRINVRRLLIHLKKEISRMASTILFDQNVQTTWDRFLGQVVPFLEGVQAGQGLTDFKVVLDDTTTTPDLVDRNILYAKIFLKPARAIEFIALDFIITRSGASFDD